MMMMMMIMVVMMMMMMIMISSFCSFVVDAADVAVGGTWVNVSD